MLFCWYVVLLTVAASSAPCGARSLPRESALQADSLHASDAATGDSSRALSMAAAAGVASGADSNSTTVATATAAPSSADVVTTAAVDSVATTLAASETTIPSSTVQAAELPKTTIVTMVPTTSPLPECVTREDPRAHGGFMTKVAEPGSPCVFGLDPADEGEHCIPDEKYGSNGWCWTKRDRSTWGACDDGCPLYGPIKALGEKVDALHDELKAVKDSLASSTSKEPESLAVEIEKSGQQVSTLMAASTDEAEKSFLLRPQRADQDRKMQEPQATADEPEASAFMAKSREGAEKSLLRPQKLEQDKNMQAPETRTVWGMTLLAASQVDGRVENVVEEL